MCRDGRIFGFTIDQILSYETPKVCVINDRRIGLLYYSLISLIVVYLLGYVILYEKRYILSEQPVGSVRFSLESPQTQGTVPPPAESFPYCLTNSDAANVDVDARAWRRRRNVDAHQFARYLCQYWGESYTLFPSVEQSAMFVTTRVTNSTQMLENGCSMSSNTCRFVDDPGVTPNTFFIANVEAFTLLIDHSVTTSFMSVNSLQLPGALFDDAGHEIKKLPPPNSLGRKGEHDIITLGALLDAAGVDLDGVSSANTNRSVRDDGTVILVNIEYSNTYTFSTSNVRYQYHVSRVANTKFKGEQVITSKNIDKRVIFNRHGVRIIFTQSGTLGQFDFQTLLLSVVSGIGLVAVASFIVDWAVIKYFRPVQRLYRSEKYIETPDWASMQGKMPFEVIGEPPSSPDTAGADRRRRTSNDLADDDNLLLVE
jgi:ATP P2X receptor